MVAEARKPKQEQPKIVYFENQILSPLDEAVLAIIKLRDGSISLSEVSATLGVSKESLTNSIERLQHSNLIEKTN